MSANGQHYSNHASMQESRDRRQDQDRAARGHEDPRRASHQHFGNDSSRRQIAEQQRSGSGHSSSSRRESGHQSRSNQERQRTNGDRRNRSSHRSERSPVVSSSSSRGSGTRVSGQRVGESSRNGSSRDAGYSMQRFMGEGQRSERGEVGEEPWKMLSSFRYEQSGQRERDGREGERRRW